MVEKCVKDFFSFSHITRVLQISFSFFTSFHQKSNDKWVFVSVFVVVFVVVCVAVCVCVWAHKLCVYGCVCAVAEPSSVSLVHIMGFFFTLHLLEFAHLLFLH